MTSQTSLLALRAADESRPQKSNVVNCFAGLQAIESVSLLGEHDGIMDDELFEFLTEEAAA